MTLLGFCGLHGPMTFLLALATAILVIKLPGKDPHVYLYITEEETACGLENWVTPGVRIPGMAAAQLKLPAIALGCFWQVWSSQSAPGQLCNLYLIYSPAYNF